MDGRDEDLFDPDSDEIEVLDNEYTEGGEVPEETPPGGDCEAELKALNDKYLRLYAEFDNYRKRMAREREDLVKFANEDLLYELLPSIDNLEIALRHAEEAGDGSAKGIADGVGITLRELYRTLEKFGLSSIEAEGRRFDPKYHHAVSQVENDDLEDNMVVEEFRKGFTYRDKVLRASMVSVSKKGAGRPEDMGEAEEENG